MKKLVFYRCNICGNVFLVTEDSGVTPVCCGEPMEMLPVNKADASLEKHVPVILTEGNHVTVKIGEAPHPMEDSHHIKWVALLTDKGVYGRYLNPGDVPSAGFGLTDNEKVVSAYANCNIHGLWMKEAA